MAWCKKKKEGLRLIEPNSNLCSAYLLKASTALKSVDVNFAKEWKITTAYYAMYFSLYALLMKIGIKCEIHSCTLEFSRVFLSDYLSKDYLDVIESSLKARIESQYYVDDNVPDNTFDLILRRAPEICSSIRTVSERITEKHIRNIREYIN